MIACRRARNRKDNLVRAKLKCESEGSTDMCMVKCGKSRCQICK